MRIKILLVVMLSLLASPIYAQEVYTLQKAIEAAKANNKTVGLYKEDLERARATSEVVRSKYFPQITASGNYFHNTEVPVMTMDIGSFVNQIPLLQNIPPIPPKNIKVGDYDNWAAKIEIQQLLFASGKVSYGYKAARTRIKATEAGVESAKQASAQAAGESFYTVILAREILIAKQDALNRSQEHLKDVQTKFNSGAASRLDLLRAMIDVNNLEPEVTKAQESLSIAHTAFKRILGLNLDAQTDITGDLDTPSVKINLEDAESRAVKNNPRLNIFRFSEKAAGQLELSNRADWLPKVVAFGSYTYQKPYFTDLEGMDFLSFGAGLSIPIFDGLASLSSMKESRADQKKARVQYLDTVDQIDFDIRKAFLDMDEAARRIKSTSENLLKANEVVKIAEASYRSGAVTNLDVIDAQLAVTQVRLAVLAAKYDYSIARIRLMAATGEL